MKKIKYTYIWTLLLIINTCLADNSNTGIFPSSFTASDYPWDHGDKIVLSWKLNDTIVNTIESYSIFIATGDSLSSNKNKTNLGKAFSLLDNVNADINKYIVNDLNKDSTYIFKIVANYQDRNESTASFSKSITPLRNWFDGKRFPLFLITVIFSGSVIFWILKARKGEEIKIRKIAGLEAVDEAVGRATEMGRSILFVPGIQDMNEIQTIAGITVLSRVAKVAAEYEAKVEVPTSRALVMTAARETVQASFLAAGRPESYNQDLVYYVTDEQFGYVAYVQGMMVREKPAACFYMGAFFAESLILAETGNTIGAIQVAGTAMPAQLPFFVAACDYTLIGEEFFAASAYLSGEADQLGSLKGQDIGKAIVVAGIIIGVFALSLGTIVGESTSMGNFLLNITSFLKNVVLS